MYVSKVVILQLVLENADGYFKNLVPLVEEVTLEMDSKYNVTGLPHIEILIVYLKNYYLLNKMLTKDDKLVY